MPLLMFYLLVRSWRMAMTLTATAHRFGKSLEVAMEHGCRVSFWKESEKKTVEMSSMSHRGRGCCSFGKRNVCEDGVNKAL